MKTSTLRLIGIGLAAVLAGCAATYEQAYPPPTNPFLTGTPQLTDAKNPPAGRAALIWLKPADQAPPPEAAQRALADKIKMQFPAGKRLEIVGSATVDAASADTLTAIRKASAPFNVQQALIVMPKGAEIISPEWLPYGRDGRAIGTRTDSYYTVSLVALDLASGKSLYSVVSTGEARLLAADFEDARPWFPRISQGRSSAFIYPDRAAFPPNQVRAVALEDAVNHLIYELDRAVGG